MSCSKTTWDSPLSMASFKAMLDLMVLQSWIVRSSSDMPPPWETWGRTWRGGTGRTETRSHSGLLHLSSNPMVLTSSTLIFLKISMTWLACRSCLLSPVTSCSSVCSTSMCRPFLAYLGWVRLQWSQGRPALPRIILCMYSNLRFLFLIFFPCRTLNGLLWEPTSLLQWKQTQRRDFMTMSMKPWWYTAVASWMCPK